MVIMYAIGYIYRPGARQELVQTGLIYLSTVPPGAAVYLEGKRFAQKTPAMIRDLFPGQYQVTMSLKGYEDWSQSVPITAEQASVLDHVLFHPKRWPIQTLSSGSFHNFQVIQNFHVIPKSDLFVLETADRQVGGLYLYDTQSKELKPLIGSDSPWRSQSIEHLYAVKESSQLILSAKDKGDLIFLSVNLDDKPPAIREITSLFQEEKPKYLWWSADNKENLFVYRNRQLHRLNLRRYEVNPEFAEGTRGFGVMKDSAYILRSDGIFMKRSINGQDEKILLKDQDLMHSLFGDEGFFKIYAYPSDLFLFWGDKGQLLTNKLPYQLVRQGVKGFAYDVKKELLLIWRRQDLGIVDFATRPFERDDVFEPAPRLKWVYHGGDQINQAFLVYEGSAVIFRDGNQVLLLDLETFEEPHLSPVVEVFPRSDIYYSDDSGFLYYLDQAKGHFMSLQVVPKESVIQFPEWKETFKRRKKLS